MSGALVRPGSPKRKRMAGPGGPGHDPMDDDEDAP
jgi:hypothetical protein